MEILSTMYVLNDAIIDQSISYFYLVEFEIIRERVLICFNWSFY